MHAGGYVITLILVTVIKDMFSPYARVRMEKAYHIVLIPWYSV